MKSILSLIDPDVSFLHFHAELALLLEPLNFVKRTPSHLPKNERARFPRRYLMLNGVLLHFGRDRIVHLKIKVLDVFQLLLNDRGLLLYTLLILQNLSGRNVK